MTSRQVTQFQVQSYLLWTFFGRLNLGWILYWLFSGF